MNYKMKNNLFISLYKALKAQDTLFHFGKLKNKQTKKDGMWAHCTKRMIPKG